jgi:hypothetical protein
MDKFDNYEYYNPIKYCIECKTNKNIDEYDINKNTQFGKYPICKLCRSTKRKQINNESLHYGNKLCARCKEEQDVKKFDKDKSQKDGLQPYCKICRREISRIWASTLDGFIKKILCDLNAQCKKNKICTNLTVENIKKLYYEQECKCALTGLPLTNIAYGKTDCNDITEFFNLSIDRINRLEDYVIGNIQLIGSMIKKMKGNLSNDKFREMCKIILY